jgi:hypothetical protein
MDFLDLINKLKEPGDDGVPDSIYDDLTARFTDLSQYKDSADSKVSELQAKLLDKESEISRLKSTNYDLLMQSGTTSGDDGTTDNGAEDGIPQGIDALFG